MRASYKCVTIREHLLIFYTYTAHTWTSKQPMLRTACKGPISELPFWPLSSKACISLTWKRNIQCVQAPMGWWLCFLHKPSASVTWIKSYCPAAWCLKYRYFFSCAVLQPFPIDFAFFIMVFHSVAYSSSLKCEILIMACEHCCSKCHLRYLVK